MRLIGKFVCLLFFFSLIPLPSFAGWLWGNSNAFVTINGHDYSSEDFHNWWQNIQTEDQKKPPENPDSFIDWQLLAHEAERMELYTLPDFQHKIEVFLKVRTLMMLKNEEVDSRIEISPDELREEYRTNYIPKKLLVQIHFDDKAIAAKVYKDFVAGKPGLMELHEYAGMNKEPLFKVNKPQWYRPLQIPSQWQTLLKGLVVGQFTKPFDGPDSTVILQLLDEQGEDDADFETQKNNINERIRKKKYYALTDQLIIKLKKKYNVHINSDLFDKIDLSAPDQELFDRVLVSSDRSTVTVGYFLSQLENQQLLDRQLAADAEKQKSIKQQALNSMVANSIVAWEARDRKFEEKKPLLPIYQFYRQHRMIVELKKRLYAAIVPNTAEELEHYYTDNIKDFTQPEKVRINLVQGEEEQINSLWSEVITGRDFVKAAQEKKLQFIVSSHKEYEREKLASSVQSIVSGLVNGGVSRPFIDDKAYCLVRLEERVPSLVLPFKKVEKEVVEKVTESKRSAVLQEYLGQLRAGTTIEINWPVWEETISGLQQTAH